MSSKKNLHIVLLCLMLTGCFTLSAQNVTSDSIVIDYFEGQGIPTTVHNRVHLLKSGREKFADLFEYIRQAKHHIHLDYFNFRNDSIARAVFHLLGEKAKEGVEVRAMFDAFGNMSNNRPLKRAHLDTIRAKGIEIIEYDPIRFPWINHVFHRD
ncbi:MAG: cardiolipin synthase, partial [Phocaeicola sp.]|nr:cardiolipin synthase [Phocaeicola sp.]